MNTSDEPASPVRTEGGPGVQPHAHVGGTFLRVRKELRELWVFWVACLLVAAASVAYLPTVTNEGDQYLIPLILYGLFHATAVVPFGREFTTGTMPRLLASPVSRTRIWLEKVGALLIVLLSPVLVAWLLYQPACAHNQHLGCRDYGTLLAVAPAMAVCSGVLFSVLLKQAFTAFWLALLAPIVLVMAFPLLDFTVLKWLFGFSIIELLHNDLRPVIVIWCLITLPLGWRCFQRLEV